MFRQRDRKNNINTTKQASKILAILTLSSFFDIPTSCLSELNTDCFSERSQHSVATLCRSSSVYIYIYIYREREREREREITGTRGSHILNIDEALSLKNIEELVQDMEAIWVADTWPPMRAICTAKPPTQCATTMYYCMLAMQFKDLIYCCKRKIK
jgi:hypothetical protein